MVYHSSFWKFLEHLKKDQRDNEVMMLQLAGGHTKIKHPVRRIYKVNQVRIEVIVVNYAEYKENVYIPRCLRSISYRLRRNYVPEIEAEDVDETN